MAINNKNLNQMENELENYVSELTKPMFFFTIYDIESPCNHGNQKHFTINLCKSLEVVKKLIKYYKQNENSDKIICFLTEIDVHGNYIPYLIVDSDDLNFHEFNPNLYKYKSKTH